MFLLLLLFLLFCFLFSLDKITYLLRDIIVFFIAANVGLSSGISFQQFSANLDRPGKELLSPIEGRVRVMSPLFILSMVSIRVKKSI